MPNHVTNRLTITGDEKTIKQCIDAIGRDVEKAVRKCVDGDTICMCPGEGPHRFGWYNEETGELRVRGSNGDIEKVQEGGALPDGWDREYVEAHRVWIDFERILPMPSFIITDDLAYEDRKSSCGRNWYDWHIDNWGTKWNAYSTHRDSKGRILFDTAWAVPIPAITVLSKLFPELAFDMESFDEGWSFACRYSFRGGKVKSCTDIPCKEDNPDFCNMCMELKGYDPREVGGSVLEV